jgi:hypothetical protein
LSLLIRWAQRARCQAETPLIGLCRFPQPALSDPSLDYCRVNFRFALLEHRSSRTPDEVAIARETYWKRILLTRGEQGLNRN